MVNHYYSLLLRLNNRIHKRINRYHRHPQQRQQRQQYHKWTFIIPPQQPQTPLISSRANPPPPTTTATKPKRLFYPSHHYPFPKPPTYHNSLGILWKRPTPQLCPLLSLPPLPLPPPLHSSPNPFLPSHRRLGPLPYPNQSLVSLPHPPAIPW